MKENSISKKLYLVVILLIGIYSIGYFVSRNYSYALEKNVYNLDDLQTGDILVPGSTIKVGYFFAYEEFEDNFDFYQTDYYGYLRLVYLDPDGNERVVENVYFNEKYMMLDDEEVFEEKNENFIGWMIETGTINDIYFYPVFKDEIKDDTCGVSLEKNTKYYEYKKANLLLDGEEWEPKDETYFLSISKNDIVDADNYQSLRVFGKQSFVSFDISDEDLEEYDYLKIRFKNSGFFIDTDIKGFESFINSKNFEYSEVNYYPDIVKENEAIYYKNVMIDINENDDLVIKLTPQVRVGVLGRLKGTDSYSLGAIVNTYYFEIEEAYLLKEVDDLEEYKANKTNVDLYFETNCEDGRVLSNRYIVHKEPVEENKKEEINPLTVDMILIVVGLLIISLVLSFYYKNRINKIS